MSTTLVVELHCAGMEQVAFEIIIYTSGHQTGAFYSIGKPAYLATDLPKTAFGQLHLSENLVAQHVEASEPGNGWLKCSSKESSSKSG